MNYGHSQNISAEIFTDTSYNFEQFRTEHVSGIFWDRVIFRPGFLGLREAPNNPSIIFERNVQQQ